jgi:hypothetical protein
MSAPGIACLNSASARASVSQVLNHHCANCSRPHVVRRSVEKVSTHQDAVVSASRALQTTLGARTGRDQHEQALRGERLSGGYEFHLRHV